MKYQRTENGTVTEVSIKDGLAEINYAMMEGKNGVAKMSSISRTDYAITYKGGRSVRLVRVESAPEEIRRERVVNVRTGEVHFKSGFSDPTGKIYAQCRILPRSNYAATHAPLSCDDCKEQEWRANAKL